MTPPPAPPGVVLARHGNAAARLLLATRAAPEARLVPPLSPRIAYPDAERAGLSWANAVEVQVDLGGALGGLGVLAGWLEKEVSQVGCRAAVVSDEKLPQALESRLMGTFLQLERGQGAPPCLVIVSVGG